MTSVDCLAEPVNNEGKKMGGREWENERPTICCICRRKPGKQDLRKAIFRPYEDPSRGYCPDCYRKIMVDYGLASVLERCPELRRAQGQAKTVGRHANEDEDHF